MQNTVSRTALRGFECFEHLNSKIFAKTKLFENYFRLVIRSLGRIDSCNKKCQKSRDTASLRNMYHVRNTFLCKCSITNFGILPYCKIHFYKVASRQTILLFTLNYCFRKKQNTVQHKHAISKQNKKTYFISYCPAVKM